MRHFLFAALCLLIPLGGCKSYAPPPTPREFRAVWVATVANIDWPRRPGQPAAEQRRQIVEILDRAQALKLNAVVLQVRTSCDAMYPSPYEPWSNAGRLCWPPG